MVPIKIVKDGVVEGLYPQKLNTNIIEICEKHKNEGRALAFAFILFDFENPQITKILEDKNYWNALNNISGKFLSVFYINSQEDNFGEDLSNVGSIQKRGLYEVNKHQSLLTVLKPYLELDKETSLPSILFFQIDKRMITDYFLINLDEDKIEESFIELKSYIKEAVDNLKGITEENYKNSQPIFDAMKNGVEAKRFRMVTFKRIQKFPMQLLLSWIIGKL